METTLNTHDDLLSSLARGHEGQQLVDFIAANHIPHDWGKIEDYGITGTITGNRLENVTGGDTEYVIHLRGPTSRCTVNIATVLALAAAFCRRESTDAHEAMKSIKERANERVSRPHRDKRRSK